MNQFANVKWIVFLGMTLAACGKEPLTQSQSENLLSLLVESTNVAGVVQETGLSKQTGFSLPRIDRLERSEGTDGNIVNLLMSLSFQEAMKGATKKTWLSDSEMKSMSTELAKCEKGIGTFDKELVAKADKSTDQKKHFDRLHTSVRTQPIVGFFTGFHAGLEGTECPVLVDASGSTDVSGHISQSAVKGSFDYALVRDSQLIKGHLDITDLHFLLEATYDGQTSSGGYRVVRSKGRGALKSQSFGDIGVYTYSELRPLQPEEIDEFRANNLDGTKTLSRIEYTEAIGFEFPGYIAELRVQRTNHVTSNRVTTEIFLNDRPMSGDQINALVKMTAESSKKRRDGRIAASTPAKPSAATPEATAPEAEKKLDEAEASAPLNSDK